MCRSFDRERAASFRLRKAGFRPHDLSRNRMRMSCNRPILPCHLMDTAVMVVGQSQEGDTEADDGHGSEENEGKDQRPVHAVQRERNRIRIRLQTGLVTRYNAASVQ